MLSLDNLPKDVSFFLPLTMTFGNLTSFKLKHLVELKLQLRQGQANDALHRIRLLLEFKFFLFKTKIHINKSQKYKTRS